MSPARSPEPAPHVRMVQSVRMVLEAAILAAILWAASALTETQRQIAVLQTNIVNLQAQMAPVADLQQRVTRLEAELEARRNSGASP